MAWRWVWARAHLTAVAVSSMIWLVTGALAPAFVGAYGALALVVLGAWNTPPLLRWWYGARPISEQAQAAVLRALVPVAALRGRHQPDVLISRRVGQPVVAPSPRRLVLSHALALRIIQRQISDEQVSVHAVRALAAVPVNESRLVAAVQLFCLPWTILETVIVSITRPIGRAMPFTRWSWGARWLFLVLAVGELWQRGYWVSLAMLVAAGIATVTTPRWNHAWAVHLDAMADQAVIRHGFASAIVARPPDLTSLVAPPAWRSRISGRGHARADGRQAG